MPPMDDKAKSRISDDFKPVKEEKRSFRSEIAKMKSMGWKERLNYFWTYYKIPVIAIVASIAIIISLASAVIENKKPILISGLIINNFMDAENGEELFEKNFCEYMGEDPDDVNTSIQTDITFDPEDNGNQNQTSYYKITAEVAAGNLDFLGGDSTGFYQFNDHYGEDHYCKDLTKVLPEDLYDALKDKFYYMQGPQETTIPVGIDITGTEFYKEMKFEGKECYIGLVLNSKKQDNFLAFLRYIFKL